ncbi:MAG: peptidylprolyl isomerase [Mariprofundaceae bacterium]|nr:peptidylprolyl isomerase [Mariprofundaceae bacterium]
MKIFSLFALLGVLTFATPAMAESSKVKMTTSEGVIEITLDADKAPVTVANFLQYVRDGFYVGTIFHRVIPNFMIQGGGFSENMRKKPSRAAIVNEADNGFRNLTGTLAMARTGDPHSATAQFFINTHDNGFLDFRSKRGNAWGYAVFGSVSKGMDVVRKIEAVMTGNRGRMQNVPLQPVIIERVQIIE